MQVHLAGHNLDRDLLLEIRAALEAALAGLPMVVLYRTGTLSYQLARRMVRLDHIALVNKISNPEAFSNSG